MYLIAKDNRTVKAKHNVIVNIDMSQVWKVKRTPQCKAGEYALLMKDDNEKFTIFGGYISYDNVCDWFEMIKRK